MALRSFAVLAALVSAALAQSTGVYIPSGISVSCKTFLSTLDQNTAFEECTSPFTSALASFAPGSSPSASAISPALNSLCSSTAFSQCPQSTITAQLGSFYAACTVELTSSPDPLVLTIYESLYLMFPMRKALCSQDNSGNYCVNDLASSAAAGDASALSNNLYIQAGTSGAPTRRDSTPALLPNTTTFKDAFLPFLFLNPNNISCTACTRNIIAPYITFESACPFAAGLGNSLMLSGQIELYSSINKTCGMSFLSGAVQAAGGISSGIVSSGAPRVVGHEFSGAISVVLSAVAFMAASL